VAVLLYNSVVCVGGDGIVHEVVNGLLEKAHLDTGFDVVNDALPDDYQAVKLDMRIGIIPAGE
jgi:diacylglycerol kinase family enzyme